MPAEVVQDMSSCMGEVAYGWLEICISMEG